MTQISAADNLVIDFTPVNWQLRNGETAPMLYADASGLRYNATFSATRRLPSTGMLESPQIVQVVLGWQRSDEAWHLGLVLAPDLTASRGSRWCEMVHWPDPEQIVFEELAQDTARGLATALNVPFRFIPPQPVEAPTPPPPLPSLPLNAGLWSLQLVDLSNSSNYGFTAHSNQLVLQLSPKWKRQKRTRLLWYFFWVVVYAALSTATLTSDLALPNAGTLLPDPHMLPYLGLLTAAGLILLIIYQMRQISLQPDTILVDASDNTISTWSGRTKRREYSAKDMQSIYVSEVVRRKVEDISTEHGEMNLHMAGGKFDFLFQQGASETQALHFDSPDKPDRVRDAVIELNRYNITSDLQAMALHMAEMLHLPAWYDMRVR